MVQENANKYQKPLRNYNVRNGDTLVLGPNQDHIFTYGVIPLPGETRDRHNV